MSQDCLIIMLTHGDIFPLLVAILFSSKPEVPGSTLVPVTSKRGKKTNSRLIFLCIDQPGVRSGARL